MPQNPPLQLQQHTTRQKSCCYCYCCVVYRLGDASKGNHTTNITCLLTASDQLLQHPLVQLLVTAAANPQVLSAVRSNKQAQSNSKGKVRRKADRQSKHTIPVSHNAPTTADAALVNLATAEPAAHCAHAVCMQQTCTMPKISLSPHQTSNDCQHTSTQCT